MVQYPSNTFHYAGVGKETVDGTGVAPTKLLKYSEFSGNAQIETESDEGHVGARGKGAVISRTKAFAEPEITDRLRADGGLEQLLHAFCGTDTITTPSGGSLARLHTFSFADILPTYTVCQGYNVASEKARYFAGAVMNNLEFNFPTAESPTVTAQYLSNFPTFGETEPTLTYPVAHTFMAGEMVFMAGAVGATPTVAVPGYTEGSVSLSNNFESDLSAGATFGVVDKNMGDLTVEGNFTVKYTEDEQRKWATGDIAGLTVDPTNYNQALRWIFTGDIIESALPYQFTFDVLNAEFTNVTPTEGGDGAKSFEIEFQGLLNSSNLKFGATVQSKTTSV